MTSEEAKYAKRILGGGLALLASSYILFQIPDVVYDYFIKNSDKEWFEIQPIAESGIYASAAGMILSGAFIARATWKYFTKRDCQRA